MSEISEGYSVIDFGATRADLQSVKSTGQYQSLVRCPKCSRKLITTEAKERVKNKRFWCEAPGCGYTDITDVDGEYEAGLDYHFPTGSKTARAVGTGWVNKKGRYEY